jgi:type IV pilus assembly protein PilC
MGKKNLSLGELAVLSRQLALVIDSDISIQEGIDLISEQTTNAKMLAMLGRIKSGIQEGKTLGESLKSESETLPHFYISMLQIGEESGNLHKVLIRNAEAFEKDLKTAKKVRSAITYPIVLSVLMLGVIILLITTVMPMFRDILGSLGGEIPAFTAGLINFSSFLGDNILAIIGLIAVIILALDLYRNTKSGKRFFDRLKIRKPIVKGIVTSLAALRFARNMSMLIKSGIPTAKAMNMVRPLMENEYISVRVGEAAEMINQGKTIREALQKIGLFPGLLVKLLAVAESTGHVDEMFDRAADIMSDELDARLDGLTAVLEPMLIILLSVILGVILLSVIFPVIDIMNTIG